MRPTFMALTLGTRLGSYEIIGALGAGGMGEVYRATDTHLKRQVAIKVLPASVAADAERLARFQREAEVLASLNHPNIAHIHGLEKSDGTLALVMELVEGATLADRITKGAIPFAEALTIAKQIAEALEAAHEQGIIHRDLKPANIKVRDDGTVKVLDFGLAKVMDPVGASGANVSMSPTITTPAMTQAGMILGTPAYMAPEQARGRSVDKHADIWAFGVVFYEMLTGRRAFEGEDVSTILAAVLQSEPRWDSVPASARRLLASCLEKDPRKRLRDIGDVWKLIDEAPTAAVSPLHGRAGWMAAATLAGVAALALWAPWRTVPRQDAPPFNRLDVDLGPDVSLLPLVIPTFSTVIISPDERRLVFVGITSGGSPRLFVRRLDDSTNTEIAGGQGATNPFFSPDGQWVAFSTGIGIAKVPIEGGVIVPLADLNTMTGGTWGDDGNLIVGSGRPGTAGLVRIPSGGGTPTPLTTLVGGEMFHSYPRIVPGHNAVLFTSVNSPPGIETSSVEILSLTDGRRKMLVRGASAPRYLTSGHLAYANRGGIFAVPFDIDTWETRGSAVPIAEDAAFDPLTATPPFDVSRGTLVYRKTSGDAAPTATHVQWLDGTGRQEPLLQKPGLYAGPPRLSPDGRRLAIAIRDGANQDIWIYDIQRDAMTRLTSGGDTFVYPVWSPDGRYVIFGSHGGIWWTRADGSGRPQGLFVNKAGQFPTSLTRDGKRLAFFQVDGRPQIWSVDLTEDSGGLKAGTPTPFLTTPHQDLQAAFSPDGKWIAYQSNESGGGEVYVRPFLTASSGQEGQVQISSGGGGEPVWSPNGRELLYHAGGEIMAVGYSTRDGWFHADKPRVWARDVSGSSSFDIAPDGKRLALIRPTATREATRSDHSVVFLQNVLDELRRRAPSGR
jgi:serine/threonine protein kinase/Tol biopolymer transport system component